MTEETSEKQEYDLNLKAQERFRERMVVVTYRSWLAIAFLIFVACCFITWTFLGSISIDVVGRGITLTKGGGLSLPTKVEGQVEKIYVSPGDEIEENDPIATLYDLTLEVELKNARNRKRELAKDFLTAKKLSESEKNQRNQALNQELDATLFELNERKNQLPFLIKNLSSKKTLYQEGLVAAGTVQQAEMVLMQEKITIEELQAKIARIEKDLAESYKSDELKNYQRLFNDAIKSVNELEAKSSFLNVVSPIEGRVLEVRVSVGEEVKAGQSLVWIERPPSGDDPFVLYCYFPAVDGNKVKPGMTANIELSTVDKQKDGYLVGKVSKISEFPVTDLHVYSIVHSEDLVEYLTAKNPAVVEVVIIPVRDPATPSGYEWTSGVGPNIDLRSGLIGSVRVTVEKRTPISYLFPEWWWMPDTFRTD